MGETDIFVHFVREKYKDEDIKVILDLGSRDGLQSVELANHYPNAKILAFECNPETFPEVVLNTNNYENIQVFALAVGDKHKEVVDFYQSTHGNPGSSSLFEKSGKYDYIENYQQKLTKAVMIRLEDFLKENGIDQVDLVWADMQGAELMALRGLGKYLKYVKGVMTEVEYKEMYKGQPLYADMRAFLEVNGFEEKWKKSVHDDFFGEAIYIR
jgi:FkbM family methyltransferase